ncbi:MULTISPECIES: ABC transporter permease [unclassified Mycobacterium]|uniref:ABC transporter permease n=1 Tax=unclassified Mycobacterium TaxID=2642494 RepID=UPI0029C7CFD0|nr:MULTISPECIES: ABC transporter permease [unclassified Mycobacterium]
MRGVRSRWRHIGDQTRFYGQTLRSVVDVFVHYRAELFRQIAMMSLGTGALAMIGGTVAVVSFLNVSTGAIIAAQGYNQLSQVGVEALTGFASAYLTTRLISLATAVIAFSATLGAGATAQIGAMRINEEIDALEVMGIRPIAYLASTRVVAGVIVVVPLYTVALLLSYLAARFGTTALYGQSVGVYDHYFRTFLVPADVIRSVITVLVLAVVVMLVHTYYGFNATGGPAGVGAAVGRATRAALVVAAFVILLVTLALYGQTGHFDFAG